MLSLLLASLVLLAELGNVVGRTVVRLRMGCSGGLVGNGDNRQRQAGGHGLPQGFVGVVAGSDQRGQLVADLQPALDGKRTAAGAAVTDEPGQDFAVDALEYFLSSQRDCALSVARTTCGRTLDAVIMVPARSSSNIGIRW
jgi:hypothetical protein